MPSEDDAVEYEHIKYIFVEPQNESAIELKDSAVVLLRFISAAFTNENSDGFKPSIYIELPQL